jgi:S1-C subfamily serine protease
MTEPVVTPLQDFSAALARLVADASPAVVSVRSDRSRSSGFIWRPGLIVTADEALAEEGDVAVRLAGGDAVPARLVGRDPTTDIALVRIDRSDPPVASLRTPSLAAGALALVLGAEQGQPTMALGAVSRAGGPWRSLRGGEIDARIELDVALRRNVEGGLALDAAGQAFGMVVRGPRRRVLVIPAATIDRVAGTLESHGRIARGYLGLGLHPVHVEGGKETGAMVMSVDPQGPGSAQVHQGDIIVSWNGEPVRHVQSLIRMLGPNSVGQTITLGLHRRGETQTVALTIAERPAA